MKYAGLLLLPAGWAIVISAVVMFSQPVSQWIFVLSGLSIQGVGLVLAFR